MDSLPTEIVDSVCYYLDLYQIGKLSTIYNIYNLTPKEIRCCLTDKVMENAICYGSKTVVEILLSQDYKPIHSIIELACWCKQIQIAKLLYKNYKKEFYNIDTEAVFSTRNEELIWLIVKPSNDMFNPKSLDKIITRDEVENLRLVFKMFYRYINKEELSEWILFTAARFNSRKVIKYLVTEQGFDINFKSTIEFKDDTAFFHAVHWGDIETIKLFIELGADINFLADTGAVPLHSAIYSCRKEKVLLLIEYGANINTNDASNKPTPLGALCNMNCYEDVELVEKFIELGAEVNVPSHKPSPLKLAMENKLYETSQLLIKHGAHY